MKICIIGKSYPIEGGVSRDTFWLSYALANAGAEVYLVTNSQEVEQNYRIFNDSWNSNLPESPLRHPPSNLKIFYVSDLSKYNYIPWAKPFVTALASLATQAIEQYGCDMIYSHYLEPYGVAAHLASQWTKIPYGLRHAGSDVGRLMQAHQLRRTYEKVILSANFIFASESTYRRFVHLGVDPNKIHLHPKASLPTKYYSPDAVPLDINELVIEAQNTFDSLYGEKYIGINNKRFDPSRPTIGIYGKVGEAKGSYDLINALSKLKKEGLVFNFVAVTQGRISAIDHFFQKVYDSDISEFTWVLPFIPHWYIPNFIKSCTAVCFLERNFSIKIHHPAVPREVFACGTCLILSSEIAAKQSYQDKFENFKNVVLVDPLDEDDLSNALRRLLTSSSLAGDIGMNGYKSFSAGREDFEAYEQRIYNVFHNIKDNLESEKAIMSMAEMQSCLSRLYTDSSFRKLFYLEPDETIEDYELTGQEIQAIKSLDKQFLTRFANSLVAKRQKRFEFAYPMTFKLDYERIKRYFKRYYDLHPAKPYEPIDTQINDFGIFLEQTLASDESLPNYASNVVKYERLYYNAKFVPQLNETFENINMLRKSTNSTYPVNPKLSPGVIGITFEFPIISIIGKLQENIVPSNIEIKQSNLVFQQVESSLNPKVFEINDPTKQLIDLCNGILSVDDIVDELKRKIDQPNLKEAILPILQKLTTMNIIC